MKKNRKDIISKYFVHEQQIMSSIPHNAIESLVDLIEKLRVGNKTLFVAGNGGSATTSSHFATDIGVGSVNRSNPVRVISLCDSISSITAVSNDLNYELIFEQQLKLLGQPGDLLLVISASGNSKNLINALGVANILGMNSFSLTGFDGGQIRKITNGNNVHIETPKGEYGLVEDIHLAICHVVTECIRS